MNWYWTASSIPGFQDLSPRVRRRVWRRAGRLLWRRGPYVFVMVVFFAVYFVAVTLAMILAGKLGLGAWGEILLVAVFAVAAGVPGSQLLVRSRLPYFDEARREIEGEPTSR